MNILSSCQYSVTLPTRTEVFLRITVLAARPSALQKATILGLAARHASTSGCISSSGIFAPMAFSAPTPPP